MITKWYYNTIDDNKYDTYIEVDNKFSIYVGRFESYDKAYDSVERIHQWW